jgi:tetratricopeptide (TPR) repeat protein
MDAQSSVLPTDRPNAFQEASEAWRQRDYQKTIELLKRATEQQPGNLKLLLNLGEAYGLRYEYEQAGLWLDQAVTVAPNKARALSEAGRRCQRFRQPALANRYFRRAAEQPDVSPAIWVALSEFEEGHSRVDAALAFLQRALDMQPDDAAALVVRARLHRACGELEQGEKVLRSALQRAVGEVAARAWYELGTNLDRQGSYDQAMQAFLQAKALIRPGTAECTAELRNAFAEFRALEQSVSGDLLRRWVAAGAALRPQRRFAFLCGHPRSGTTLLEQVLDSHRDILATDETPILFGEVYQALSKRCPATASVVEVLESASLDALRKARADYFRFTEAFIGRSIGDRLLIDKNPAMDVRMPIVARIFPEAAFLVALRDPRDVCLSCFMLPLTTGEMGALYLSLEETVAHYVSVMGFSSTMRLKLPNPQLEVRYEDVVADLESASRRVLRFLGVDWDPEVLRFDDHAKRRLLRCAVDEAVAKPIFKSSIGRWRHYQKHLEPNLPTLEPFITAFGYG